VVLFRVGREEMEFLHEKIDKSKQKIQQDERDYRHATDPAEAERLKEIIDGDKATLRGLYDTMAQIASQSAPSKF
jgi:hypothetical protein